MIGMYILLFTWHEGVGKAFQETVEHEYSQSKGFSGF